MLLLLLLSALGTSQAFFWGSSSDAAWNGLKVTFGLNPFSSYKSLPRTRADAVSEGYRQQNSACDASNGFLGYQYVKGNDHAAVLLFDTNGYIAGMQAIIPRGLPRNFPSQFQQSVFRTSSGGYTITAYFVDPAKICSGRTQLEYDQQGTGTGLYLQSGPNPLTDYMQAPNKQSDMATTKWTLGKCFPVMGVHYWYDTSEDMSCDNTFPVFLLYNKGKLNAFGWAFNADFQNPRYEHPPSYTFNRFMKVIPRCLAQQGTLSTLHIYLTDSATSNLC